MAETKPIGERISEWLDQARRHDSGEHLMVRVDEWRAVLEAAERVEELETAAAEALDVLRGDHGISGENSLCIRRLEVVVNREFPEPEAARV